MDNLEKRIAAIEERNARVEENKKWERNPLRIIAICILTYGIVLLYSYLADTSNIFLSSAVPVIGFLLSTLSVTFIRKLWNKRREQN